LSKKSIDLKNITKHIRIATNKMIVNNMISDFSPTMFLRDFKRDA